MVSLQSCNDSDINYCPDITPVVTPETNFYQNVSLPLLSVDNGENSIGITCHNCYDNNSVDANDTMHLIEYAISSGVHFIELDIVIPAEDYNGPVISHEQAGSHVLLTDIVSYSGLIESEQLLFLELKGDIASKQDIRDILNVLMSAKKSNGGFAYFNQSRFVTMRAYKHDVTLATLRDVLLESEYAQILPFIKFSRLHHPKTEQTLLAEIKQSYECGMHMVELDVRLGTDSLILLNAYAETLGLAVNIFTIDESNYRESVQSLKTEVDMLTVEERNISYSAIENSSLFDRIQTLLIGH